MLIRESLAYAAREGLEAYEFLGCVEPWTQVWTQQAHACVSLRAYPCRASGLAALSVDGSAYLARKLRRR